MRTSRLRRWLVRGILFGAAVAGPFVAAGSANAEWTWNGTPPASSTVTTVDSGTTTNTVDRAESYEWTWN